MLDEDSDMEDASMIENNDSKERQIRERLIDTRKAKVLPSLGAPQHADVQANNLLWIKLVIDFFELSQMATTEKESALKIEEFFCNIRRLHVKN